MNMENNNMKQTTFWKFLKDHKIEIPIIQRDYAQGRIGKEKLREKFLADLKNALDGKLPPNEKVLKLDFVYGSTENECFIPLDGQQRLTTLWLLHWYIAIKAGVLSDNKTVFKNFSYETRISSREFCKKLTDFKSNIKKPIVVQIQKQTWFYSAWKQDPTIQAMLNMLGGTPIVDETKKNILDGIEEVFVENFEDYWEKLSGENCPIIFYCLDLVNLKLSDDLYIKMNARGKQLTNFENFKADLVGHIKKKKCEKNKTPKETTAHKLDTIWTEIFWKYKSDKHEIDAIYFTFLKRYCLNSLIVAQKKENEEGSTINKFWFTAEKIEQSEWFKNIWNLKLEYTGFDVFNPKEDNIELFDYKLLNRLKQTLDNFHNTFRNTLKEDINRLFYSASDSSFRFIPDYIKNTNYNINNPNTGAEFIPRTITQPQRIVFHAICCYFANGQYDEISFKQWLRVVWNIVENANITGTQPMIGAMRLIDDLAYFSHEIYSHLKVRDISKDFAKEQMEEEKEKAKQILFDNTNSWENKIIEAERTAFFNGSIRFLFRTGVNTYDWNNFDKRFEKSKLYFDEKGVKSEFRKDARLICTLISLFTKWRQCWGEKKVKIGNGTEVWSYIIKNDNLLQPLVGLLDLDTIPLEITNFSSPIEKFDDGYGEMEKLVHEDMCNNRLIKEAINIMDEGIMLNWRNNHFALYRPNANANWKKYVIGNMRNKIFFDLRQNGIILTQQNISEMPYFWGWEIDFTSTLNNKKYRWWDALKEQTENGEWKVVPDVNLDNLEEYLNGCLKNPIGELKYDCSYNNCQMKTELL